MTVAYIISQEMEIQEWIRHGSSSQEDHVMKAKHIKKL